MSRSADSDVLVDLRAEHEVLDELLASLDADAWNLATPAEGWTIADTVRHLLVAERAALRSARDGIDFVGGSATRGPEEALPTDREVLLHEWRITRDATVDALAARPDGDRVPWGGRAMSVRSLATARLMETWAHGLDCFDAADRPAVDTDRLVHVAWLGRQTLPYAFAVAGEEPPAPPNELFLELRAPSGATWKFGPQDSPHRIHGPASTWCRVATRRLRPPAASDLVATGALATAALRVAKAYLA
jgi:uncharacterized protein (TIGR03084 family)